MLNKPCDSEHSYRHMPRKINITNSPELRIHKNSMRSHSGPALTDMSSYPP
ncbi:unnamed protein product, partial [Nesidiocoris tenuis]